MDYELNRQGVRRVSHDAATLEMRIEFMRGPIYAYDAVPEAIVAWLVRTKEPAGYIQRVVTPRFAYRKVRSLETVSGGASEQDLEAQLRASLASVGKAPNDQ